MKITLLIPMYNEEDIVAATLDEVTAYMKKTFEKDYEILLVNDGSRDGCAEIVRNYKDPAVRLCSYEENRGKGHAIRTGVGEALGDVIFFTDCDLAYGCDVIKTFYDRLTAENAPDVAVGSRSKHKEGYAGYSFLRKVVSKVYLKVLRIFGGLSLSDSQCGCKGFCSEAAKRIFSHCEVDRFAFDFEAILVGQHLGMTFDEIPVKVERHGKSSVHVMRDTFKMLSDLRKMKKRIKKIDA